MLKTIFQNYTPKNEQETIDRTTILAFIDNNPDALERTNTIAHITVSAIVINDEATHVLFAHHNIYNSWAWVGGHADGNPDLLEVALKETREETGLKDVAPVYKDPFMVDILQVTNHIKHGRYVGDHLHLNATYLLRGDATAPLSVKPDENSGVRWFTLDEALTRVSEPRMIPVYQKAFDAIREMTRDDFAYRRFN